jgi:hypothetical protein
MIKKKLKFEDLATSLGHMAILYSINNDGVVQIHHTSKPFAERKDGDAILKQWEQQGLYISSTDSTIHAEVINLFTDYKHVD